MVANGKFDHHQHLVDLLVDLIVEGYYERLFSSFLKFLYLLHLSTFNREKGTYSSLWQAEVPNLLPPDRVLGGFTGMRLSLYGKSQPHSMEKCVKALDLRIAFF